MSSLTRNLLLKQYHCNHSLLKLVSKHNSQSLCMITNQKRNNSDINDLDFNFDDDNNTFDFHPPRRQQQDSPPRRQQQDSFDMFRSPNNNNFFDQQRTRKSFSRSEIEWNTESLTPFRKDFYIE
eukprot:256390_1